MSTPAPLSDYRQGLLYALGCYLIWGLFPLYWYPINTAGIGADQILAQRISWSAAFAVVALLLTRKTALLWHVLHQPRVLAVFAASALAISLNWLVYLWAITNSHILDASLGYFMSPLMNVLFGCVFFKERLNRAQLAAIVLALVGILWLAVPAGHIPWVSLLLAGSFGVYSLLRKLAPLDALAGMTLETLLMLPFALGYLWYADIRGVLVFGSLPPLPLAVLIGSGAATVIPLLCFAAAAKRISMSDLGMIQYVSPTMQFVLGLVLFNEAFNAQKLMGYAWVWLAVVVYVWGVLRIKNRQQAV